MNAAQSQPEKPRDWNPTTRFIDYEYGSVPAKATLSQAPSPAPRKAALKDAVSSLSQKKDRR